MLAIPAPYLLRLCRITLMPICMVKEWTLASRTDILIFQAQVQLLKAFSNSLWFLRVKLWGTKLPNYVPRKSRNERATLFPDDSRYTTKVIKKQPKATKPAPIKPQRVGAANASSSSESESPDDSEYDSSDSEFEAIDPSPLASTRPMNPEGAVEYDSIKALWRRSSAIDSEDVRKGLGEYWEVVRTIRDRWKTDGENVKQAVENKKLSELPLLKSRVQDQCDMIEVALKTAIQHGNTMIVENFGLNAPFLFLLYQFLIDRSREGDYDGELSRVILEILSRCTTLTNQALEKTYLAKVLPKFAKRGDITTMALVKRITDAASAGTKKSAVSGKTVKPAETKTKDVKTKSPPSAATPPSTVIGVKRPRPGDAPTGQPPKRVASGGVPSNPANPAPPKSAATLGKRPVPVVSTAKTLLSANATITAKPKAQQVVAKSPSLFSSLQSASKRPGTSNAVKAAVVPQKAAITGILPTKKSTTLAMPTISSSKPAFSFAETMANLTKPKESDPTVKPKEETPVETEEARVKRLRKEERRKLRVSWRPEANLVEVRLFTHDPEEELGHDESMVRDVGDVGGEGRMFKQHKDMIEVDEEDTDGLAREETFLTFTTPTLIDFSVVDLEERERNYSPYGGGLKESGSAEREVQERHEASTLMVFYTHPSDIPPCPREPADPYTGEPHVTNAFGKPPDSVLARESLLAGSQAPVPAPAASDISALLNALSSQQAQHAQQTQQQQPAQPQTSATELERIFATFAATPQQPQAAAAPAGHTPQPAQAQPDISAIMAAMQTQPPIQQQQQPQPQPSAALPAGQLNLSAIMASLGQGGMPQMPSMPGMPGTSGFVFTPNPNPSAQPPSYDHPYENEDRKRYRENDYDYDGGTGVQQGGGKRKKGAGKKFTLPCKYWKQGKCQKGDACTYVHE
ncbi:hypothetical protein LTR04_003851 [Oleoguttula sp. CCFEE 6159]|nr:hypothetical protein LTR04_003851 [Oleoguttula sp. CCFEE 6159]